MSVLEKQPVSHKYVFRDTAKLQKNEILDTSYTKIRNMARKNFINFLL